MGAELKVVDDPLFDIRSAVQFRVAGNAVYLALTLRSLNCKSTRGLRHHGEGGRAGYQMYQESQAGHS
jgi:hypothetical protein